MVSKPFRVIRKCPICYKTEDLKTCTGCLLINFCGKEHQIQFWPRHKDLCQKVMQLVKDSKNATTIYDVKPFQADNMGDDKEQLQNTIMNLLTQFSTVLGRELFFDEKMLLMHPKYCKHCGNSNIKHLVDCPDCANVSFCKTGDCRVLGAVTHGEHCFQYSLQLQVNFDAHLKALFTELSDVPKVDITKFPKDLYELVKMLTGKTFSRRPRTEHQREELVQVSTFSFTATCLYILHLCKALNPDRERLTIHVVGVKHEYGYFNDENSFPFFAYMTKLKTLEFFLIGPEIMSTETKRFDLPKGRLVKVRHFPCMYEQIPRIAYPDLIVCFNSGFTEIPYGQGNTWIAGIKKILSNRSTPAAFTSYSTHEATCDAEFIERVAKEYKTRLTKLHSGRNPFRDYRPIKNFMVADELDQLFYANNYLSIYEIQK